MITLSRQQAQELIDHLESVQSTLDTNVETTLFQPERRYWRRIADRNARLQHRLSEKLRRLNG